MQYLNKHEINTVYPNSHLRYMAEILQIWRKILYNQSIPTHVLCFGEKLETHFVILRVLEVHNWPTRELKFTGITKCLFFNDRSIFSEVDLSTWSMIRTLKDVSNRRFLLYFLIDLALII